jgi:hypothetical protein
MVQLEDYELTQTIHRALQDLRSRATPATRLELDSIAAPGPIACEFARRVRLLFDLAPV